MPDIRAPVVTVVAAGVLIDPFSKVDNAGPPVSKQKHVHPTRIRR